ncbi:hypothetical protein [Oscillibacter sp. 1-3]|nr:hypothetical protein [Oscillibacter sp. 1-3]EOS67074.1 hypothetical protein C816_01223 [Oscillibacter sp. 1-3]
MAERNGRDNHFAGGLGLLAAAVYLCVKGLKRVEERLQKREKR